MKHIKSRIDFINENFEGGETNEPVLVKEIDLDGQKLFVYKYYVSPYETSFYVEDENGEPYIDINKNIQFKPVLNGIWVQQGGEEEKIANMLVDDMKKTITTTTSGYNTYTLYIISDPETGFENSPFKLA